MISSDFVKRKEYSAFDNSNAYIYDYLLYSLMYEEGKTLVEIRECLEKYINSNEFISEKELSYYLNTNFDFQDNEHYILTDNQNSFFKKYLDSFDNVELFNEKNNDELKLIVISNENLYDSIIASVFLSFKNRDLIRAKSRCFYIFKNIDNFEKVFINIITELEENRANSGLLFMENNFFDRLPLIPQTKYQKKMMTFLNYNQFKDVNNNSFYDLLFIFIENPLEYLEQLLFLSPLRYNKMCNSICVEYDNFNDNQKTVFNNRFVMSCSDEPKTLQEISNVLLLTRERVRQIESKLLLRIKKVGLKGYDLKNIFSYCDTNSKGYLSLDCFTNIISNNMIKKYLITYLNIDKDNIIKIDLNNNVIFNSCITNIKKIFTDLETSISNVVSNQKYNNMSLMEKIYVNNNYKLNNGIYMRSGVKPGDLYLSLIDEYFPTGYRISSDEDYNLLMEKFITYYNIKDNKSKRYIASILDRSNSHCLCDRGKYINYSMCPQIPDYLLEQIIDYIKSSKYVVYYGELFNRFMFDLTKININNQFLLKGILDRELDDAFKTSRDGITYGDQIGKWEAILGYMRAQKGIFNLRDLAFEFPNTSYVVFQSIISYESENGLLILYDKKFIYAKNTNIEILKSILKERIDNIFDSLKSDYVTSHKLFACIALSDDNIFKDVSFEVDGFNLYSIVKYLYPDDYMFRRPIISKTDKGYVTSIRAIHDYLIQYDEFDKEMVAKYIREMDLPINWISYYQELCNYMSKEFLQISKTKMLKKEKIDVDDYSIESIDKALDSLTNKYGDINISKYNGYFIFPQIDNLDWNEFLIIGFINSYLEEKYEFYNKGLDNYIRRINYEL